MSKAKANIKAKPVSKARVKAKPKKVLMDSACMQFEIANGTLHSINIWPSEVAPTPGGHKPGPKCISIDVQSMPYPHIEPTLNKDGSLNGINIWTI